MDESGVGADGGGEFDLVSAAFEGDLTDAEVIVVDAFDLEVLADCQFGWLTGGGSWRSVGAEIC